MTTSAATPSAAGNPSRVLPWLLLLFAGSGASALVYEIVWYQMLMLTIGANAVSLGVLLATYMGGLSLGSWLLPKFLAGRWSGQHPLKVYAYIEIAVAAFAVLLLGLMPLIDKMYVGVASPNAGFFGIALRAIFCAIALLPPTILMGASLPAIARWAESSRKGASWWGLFYGVNIFGAVIGVMAAGFWLMRFYNIYVGTGVAAGVNILVAGLGLWLASRVPPTVEADTAEEIAQEKAVAPDPAPAKLARWGVLISIALSGAASMGGQVIWARILGPMLGGTVYVFSIILAVFLIGLGFGAWAGSAIGKRFNGRNALGWSQVLAAVGLAWTAYQFSSALPYWPMNPLQSTTFMVTVQSDFVRVLWGILPATLCWGAAVPLAFAAMRGTDDAGKTVGGVYAANTLGAIFGALLVSLVVIPGPGTHFGERLLIAVSVLAAFAAFAPSIFAEEKADEPGSAVPLAVTLGLAVVVAGLALGRSFIPALSSPRGELVFLIISVLAIAAVAGIVALSRGGLIRGWGALACATMVSLTLIVTLKPVPPELIAYGRRTAAWLGQYQVLDYREGMNSSIAYTTWLSSPGSIQFHVAGKVEASNLPQDMSLERQLGYVPILTHPNPKSVLIVGFGAGITAGDFVTYPSITKIKICDIEPKIPPASTQYFGPYNHYVKNDPRTSIVYDDARHYVLTTREKFDIISTDPIHPFVKGLASLYSVEYFKLLRDHLNPGGVVTQWIPIYESDFPTVKSEIASFMEAFKYVEIYANVVDGGGYDLTLVGHQDILELDAAGADARLMLPEYSTMRQSMQEVGFPTAQSLLDTYTADKVGLADWLRNAQLNHDTDMRLQYLAGFSMDQDFRNEILREIQAYKRPPVGLRLPIGFGQATPPAAAPGGPAGGPVNRSFSAAAQQ